MGDGISDGSLTYENMKKSKKNKKEKRIANPCYFVIDANSDTIELLFTKGDVIDHLIDNYNDDLGGISVHKCDDLIPLKVEVVKEAVSYIIE